MSGHTETATDSNASTDADANRTYDVPKEKDAEDKDSSRCDQRSWMRETPRQLLAELRIKPGITNVLIGDSVICNVKPELMFSARDSQNITVSGMTIEDLIHWLRHVPRNRGR